MSRFEVDSAQMAATSSAVQSSSSAVAGEVAALMRNLEALPSSWRGQASSVFQELAQRWRVTQDRVRQDLDDINRALAAAGQQYAEVEAANARMFAA
ncbi:WXG100 family type VII secretion target [Kineococcus gynurae]|uniref:ESAT-6-like protein n=1 Tax=Kineococcus gynurae TaxID=452979 RepID=A0ABV5LWN4_9ACTN